MCLVYDKNLATFVIAGVVSMYLLVVSAGDADSLRNSGVSVCKAILTVVCYILMLGARKEGSNRSSV